MLSAASGSLYALVDRSLPQRSGAAVSLRGAAFGLLVWAPSFEALLPQLQVMPRTTQGPIRTWPAPLFGHAVIGVVTAVVSRTWERRLPR